MLSGKELEEATAPVVRAILAGADIGTRQFTVVPNKTVKRNGVSHEIDIHVTEEPGGRIYLFECKNWNRSVGADVVIVLKRWVDLIGATRGYIVALHFSENARLQAAHDGIELLDAKKHEINRVRLCAFNGYAREITIREVRGDAGPIPADLNTRVQLDTEELALRDVLTLFAKDSVAQRIVQPDVLDLSLGTHDVACFSTVTPPTGSMHIAGTRVVSVSFECPIVFTASNPPIHYGYDITAQHIVAKFEKFQVGENQWADTVMVSEHATPHGAG